MHENKCLAGITCVARKKVSQQLDHSFSYESLVHLVSIQILLIYFQLSCFKLSKKKILIVHYSLNQLMIKSMAVMIYLRKNLIRKIPYLKWTRNKPDLFPYHHRIDFFLRRSKPRKKHSHFWSRTIWRIRKRNTMV